MITLGLLAIAGCRTSQNTIPPELSGLPVSQEIAEILGLKITTPLEVVLASPQGVTSEPSDYESVTIVFNQPIKALSATSADIAEPFKISPPIQGTFRWKGTATVSFTPHHPFLYGTKYTITVPSGLKSLSQNALKNDASFSFTTPAPRIIATSPVEGQPLAPNGILALSFNQPIDPKKVQDLLHITSPPKAPSLTVRLLTETEATSLNEGHELQVWKPGHAVVLEPSSPLPAGQNITLRLDKGLVGEVGPEPTLNDQVVSFTTVAKLSAALGSTQDSSFLEDGIPLTFSTEVRTKELLSHLKISPTVALDSDPEATDSFTNHTLYGAFQPHVTYTLTLDPKLQDIYGQTLGPTPPLSWTTGDREPLVQLPEGIGVLEAQGPRTLPMGLRNITRQTLYLKRLSLEQVQTMAAKGTSSWFYSDKPYDPPGGFDLTQSLHPQAPANETVDRPIDLKPLLKGHKYGFIYYRVDSVGGTGKNTRSFTHQGLAQITNLTATGKFSPENSLVLATTLDKAKPLKNVSVTFLQASGHPVWTGRTGNDGRVQAPGWTKLIGDPADPYAEAPLTVFLQNGEDRVFVHNGDFGTIWPWQFNIPVRNGGSSHQPTAKAYTERGLYRPGENIEIKGAIRDRAQGHWTITGLKTLDYELFNSRDESLEKGQVKISDYGTFHHTLKTATTSPTGTYRIDYKLPEAISKSWKISPELTGLTFRVEEFQPADFQVTVSSDHKATRLGGEAPFQVKASWLFDAPVQNETFQWSAYLSPNPYQNPAYPQYQFGPLDFAEGVDTQGDELQPIASGTGLTDNHGMAEGKVNLQGLPFQGDGLLVVEATVTSAHRRSVTGRLALDVAPGAFRIGASLEPNFVTAESPLTLHAVVLTPEGSPLAKQDVTVELIRRQWNSVRKSGPDGSFRWTSVTDDSTVSSQNFTSGIEPQTLTLTPPRAGFYIVRLHAQDELKQPITTETSFYAAGSDEVAWARQDDDTIELVADKSHYQPGDTAHVLVKSPFKEATALITYERDLILESKVVTLKGNAPVLDIPLTESHLPNVYVSVMLLRGRLGPTAPSDKDDITKPSFKMGYINLPVQSESKRLSVKISTDKNSYGPGDEVVTDLKVTDAQGQPVTAELSLTAADLGALQLIDYQTPDFFDTFYGEQPLGVRTAESLLDVIGQRSYGTKGENSGGGGGYDSAYRSDFRLTALWKPAVRTDSKGHAQVRFKLPESLTTFRLMATAITEDTRCGKGESDIVLKKTLTLKPSLPAYALVGDSFQAGVLAVNTGTTDHLLKVSPQVQGLTATLEPKEIFLKAGEEREVLFNFQADQVGQAHLSFQAELGPYRDGLKADFPVKPVYGRTTLAVNGKLEQGSITEKVSLPTTMISDSLQAQLTLSSSLLGGLGPSLEALEQYPYGCLEQRLARLDPLLLSSKLAERLGLAGFTHEKAKAVISTNLGHLADYQRDDGGLGLWPDAAESNPYLTAQALRTAHTAIDAGYQVGPWTKATRAYLKSFLDGSQDKTLGWNQAELLGAKAMALAALSQTGFPGTPYLHRLVERRSQLTAVGKASLLEAAYHLKAKDVKATLTQELTNAFKLENATAYLDVKPDNAPWLYSDKVHDTGRVLSTLLKTGPPPAFASQAVTWLLNARGPDGTWQTTSANASALSALWTFSQAVEGKLAPAFSVTPQIANTTLDPVSFGPKTPGPQVLTLSLKTGETPITLAKKGAGSLFYALSVSYEDKAPVPAQSEGITVLRSLTDLEGNPVQDLKGGQLYRVNLSVISPQLRRFAVLENAVPAGLSVVQSDFATESQELLKLLARSQNASGQTFTRFETYSDRVTLFADTLAPGEHTYAYLVRAQTPGTFHYPAATCYEMYHPELFGRTSTTSLTITTR